MLIRGGLYNLILMLKEEIKYADFYNYDLTTFSNEMHEYLKEFQSLILCDSTLEEIDAWDLGRCLEIMDFIKRATVEPFVFGSDEFKRQYRNGWLKENIHILNSPPFIEVVLIVTCRIEDRLLSLLEAEHLKSKESGSIEKIIQYYQLKEKWGLICNERSFSISENLGNIARDILESTGKHITEDENLLHIIYGKNH
ncbi:MAG: hypothetical protein NTX85_00740 [Candidatus Nomurabacteria bacterium]|nr:hypothetical protein [Candidatus Nomurabacteria bacterium]